MEKNALAAIQSTAINRLTHQSASLSPSKNSGPGSIKQSEAICDTLETGDPDSGDRLIPQPTTSAVVNPDDDPLDDSIHSGSILDIAG